MNRVLVPPVTEPPTPPVDATLVELGGPTMGTTWSVRAYVPNGAERAKLDRLIDAALGRIIDQMSSWAPHSDLSRFNSLPNGGSIILPEDFRTVLACALRVADETGGAFDPTIGGLVDLWGFGAVAPVRNVPLDTELEHARAQAGWRKLAITNGQLKRHGHMRLDLSGIAKGYAADLLASVLREFGAQSFLIEIGGEVVGRGVKPDGQPWWVELEHPPGFEAPRTIAALHNLAIATSGDYRRSAVLDGKAIAHTIDPATGRPLINGVVSVSVVHASCMEADAYATALSVLGGERAVEAANARALAMRCIERTTDGLTERRSRAFDLMLEDSPAPRV